MDDISISTGVTRWRNGYVGSIPGQAANCYWATSVYSAFHPSGTGVDKSSCGLVGWSYGGASSLVSGGR